MASNVNDKAIFSEYAVYYPEMIIRKFVRADINEKHYCAEVIAEPIWNSK